ncbi:MAG: Bax inhibitor-1/YccA family protein [Verrucomicrobiota bacterium]|nr:Bax inhibitor-1/YccA family protein [Verrucomicrobiota bacterium]
MRTANPALNTKTFSNTGFAGADAMTINGTVQKTAALLFLVVCSGTYTWHLYTTGVNVSGWMIGSLIAGLILALITIFKTQAAPITAPLYAVAEGLFLGALSAIFEAKYKGIVVSAAGLTIGTLFALLFAYRTGLIKATQNFRLGVFAATGGIAIVYLATIILGLFGIKVPYIHESGLIGIGFSLFVVVIAALNLVLDFDFIESGADSGAPRYMEWYAAFGLLVTLIWLYVEMLRLLSKLRSR